MAMKVARRLLGLSLLLAGCSGGQGAASRDRDFAAHPAFIVQGATAARVWAVSDVHGGYDRLIALLRGNGLIDASNAWAAGDDRLYVLGDMIDKSTGGLATVRFLIALQTQAADAGGEVVVTMGNHELEFLADPYNDKSAAFVTDLADAGLDPKAVAKGADVGDWLRGLPFGILDGDWFFSHAGNTGRRSVAQLASDIEVDLHTHHKTGAALLDDDSLLEAKLWWETADPKATIDANLFALPARHLVFGHDPDVLSTRGSLGQLYDARLFLIDTGMSPIVNDSQGALLLIERDGTTTTASAAFPTGAPGIIYSD
jgi:hypothetical protein